MRFLYFWFILSFGASLQDAEARKKGKPFDFYGMSGCGAGSLLLDNNDKGSQMLSWLIDDTIGGRSFAITSGTSNCDKREGIDSPTLAESFIDDQRHELARDVVRGGGPSLVSLSKLMQCRDADSLRQFMKNHSQSFMTLSGKDWIKMIQNDHKLECVLTKGAV